MPQVHVSDHIYEQVDRRASEAGYASVEEYID